MCKKRSLRYCHRGNGLSVYDVLNTLNNDFETVAHIAPNRDLTFYTTDISDEDHEQVRQWALNADPDVSYAQNEKVFKYRAGERDPVIRYN